MIQTKKQKKKNQQKKKKLLEEFYEYLEIDNVDKYRKKMKGYELPIFYNNLYNNNLNNKVKVNENKKTPIKLNSARQMYIKEMIKQRKEQTKNLEKKMIRFNGLEKVLIMLLVFLFLLKTFLKI